MEQKNEPSCPPSATHGVVAAVGITAFLGSTAAVRSARPAGDDLVNAALCIIGATAIAIFLVDVLWQKVHLRPSTGLRFDQVNPSLSRSLCKCSGLLGSMGLIALLYWIFPEYHGTFYEHYYQMLRIVLPPWILLAFPYFYLVDRHMVQPRDGYWHMGKLLTLQWREVDGKAVGQHLLSWLIRGFFLPLMFTYTCDDLGKFIAYDFARLTNFTSWFNFVYDSLYFIDVGLGTMGYLVSLRIADTHVRSAEPGMLGWCVALVCYEPFWSILSPKYLAYDTGFQWGAWLSNTPILYDVWGCMILVLAGIYVWATVSFGARFSNLTHRGIITNGPYRWTKHPAYVAKNLSWWMISIPFIAHGRPDEALRHCLELLALNGIYMLRAKTEERHLSRDPEYAAYASWMKERGIFRFVRCLPRLKRS